jgi:N-methylhydantoinase A
LTAANLLAARARFDERHAQIHGHDAKEQPVELVSYRLRLRVRVPKYEPRAGKSLPCSSANALKGKRTVLLQGAQLQALLYERAHLAIGSLIAGPAIIEQFDATTLVPPGWHARVDDFRNLILQYGG